MRRLCIVLCGWLLPLLIFADVAADIELRLIAGEYRPGDVIELHAEMQSVEYAEFVLHVPAQSLLHFVAHTSEPVRYSERGYQQRVVLLLQPMSAGAYDLNAMTATVEQGGVATELALPSVQFEVFSYGAEDTSKSPAALDINTATQPPPVSLVGVTLGAVIILSFLIWLLLRKTKVAPTEPVRTEVGLNDLIAALEGNAPSLPPLEADVWKRQSASLQAETSGLSIRTIEQLLERSDLSLSPALRQALEAAAYGNGIDPAVLLSLLREDATR